MVTIIAAAGENNALGKNNELLWHLPNDFKRFKKLTSGHCIIMGRKTFESLPGILPKRKHIIITRNSKFTVDSEQCIVVNSLEKAIEITKEEDDNPFIIGGGEIYKQSLKYADCIELTRVHSPFEADTFFPEIDHKKWKLVEEQFFRKDSKHQFDFTFLTYKRK